MSHHHTRPSFGAPSALLIPSPSVVASPSPPPFVEHGGQSSVLSSSGIVRTLDPQLVVNPNLSPANSRAASASPLAVPSVDVHPGSYTSMPVLDAFPPPMLHGSDHLYSADGEHEDEEAGVVSQGDLDERGLAAAEPPHSPPPQRSPPHHSPPADAHSAGRVPVTSSSSLSHPAKVAATSSPLDPIVPVPAPSTPPPSGLHAQQAAGGGSAFLSPSNALHRSNSLLHLRGTNKKLVLGMVGLPARGKTYIAQKLSRYLNWCSYLCQVFNIGVYRRRLFGAHLSADWFDAANEEGFRQRNQCAVEALNDMFLFFKGGGQAAVFDGTNTTQERREMVRSYIASHAAETGIHVELVWLESIVYDQAIVDVNIRETKLSSPDYDHLTAAEATADFRARIRNYERYYEPLPSDSDFPYIRLIDAGRQMITNRLVGYLMSKIAFFLMNLRVNRAPIYISRHGESQHNVLGLIGGDSELSPQGLRYAKALAKFIDEEDEFKGENAESLTVWTSTMRRTIQTASYFHLPITQWRALIEIQVGVWSVHPTAQPTASLC